MSAITEAESEGVALAWLSALGRLVLHGEDIARDVPAASWACGN